MTKSKIALATLLALSLSACAKTEAAKPDTAKISDAVKADAEQLIAAVNARDVDKQVAHDGPTYVGMFHGTPNVNGAAADKAELAKGGPPVKVTLSDESVDVAQAGDMAVYRSSYSADVTDPKTSKTTTETGNWVVVYKVQSDGSWKVALSVVSDTKPAPAATAAPAAAAAKK
jgi:ketosteroid isomerase-like protein